jgi:hypothetical protein
MNFQEVAECLQAVARLANSAVYNIRPDALSKVFSALQSLWRLKPLHPVGVSYSVMKRRIRMLINKPIQIIIDKIDDPP